jgi:hypothetical protein
MNLQLQVTVERVKMADFWDIALFSVVEVDRRFNALITEAVRTSETSVYIKAISLNVGMILNGEL